MLKVHALLAVCMLIAPQAQAQALRLVRPVDGCNFQNLGLVGAERYVRLDEGRTKRILDTATGKTTTLAPPTQAYVAARPRLFFGTAERTKRDVVTQLVNYDPARRTAGLLTTSWGQGGRQRHFYLNWDLSRNAVTWHASLGEYETSGVRKGYWDTIDPIGVDPQGRYFYFQRVRAVGRGHSLDPRREVALFRLNLAARQLDWSRAIPLAGKRVAVAVPSPDFGQFAVLEYAEYAEPGKTRSGAATGYVASVASRKTLRFPIPVTAYAVSFDHTGRYLLLGSNQLGRVYKVDLVKDRVVASTRSIKQIHFLSMAPRGDWIFVFGNNELDPRRPVVQAIPWPSLAHPRGLSLKKLLGDPAIHSGGSTATRDGRFVVLADQRRRGTCYLLAAGSER